MSFLQVTELSKKYGSTPAISGVSLTANRGEIVVLLGASGCGKTTLLRCIAGFEDPDLGSIFLNERVLVSPNEFVHPRERKVGILFQDYALFPHLTISGNIGLALSKSARVPRTAELLRMVKLETVGTLYPHQLSGGQQQRVALARALATTPNLLLLDEPYSNLDKLLRTEVRGETTRLIRQQGLTAVVVTHDADDALAMADRIAVMSKGKLEAIDTPEALFTSPKTLLVASLFGEMNVIARTEFDCLGIRPEDVLIADVPGSVKGVVTNCLPQGGRYRLNLMTEKGMWLVLTDTPRDPGSNIPLWPTPEKVLRLRC